MLETNDGKITERAILVGIEDRSKSNNLALDPLEELSRLAETAEVEYDCDYRLRYEYVIDAITAVSGYVAENGRTIEKLIRRIKFAPPKKPKPTGGSQKRPGS